MIRCARQLLGQVQLVVNQNVQTYPSDLSIFQEDGQGWLTRAKLIAGDAGLKEFCGQSQTPYEFVLRESERSTNLAKLFGKTSCFWSRGFSHQESPPDGNHALLGNRQLKRMRFSAGSSFVAAGSSCAPNSLAAPINRGAVPSHAFGSK